MTAEQPKATAHGVRFCLTGWRVDAPHMLRYNGKVQQTYTCWNCDDTITKAALKAATDA